MEMEGVYGIWREDRPDLICQSSPLGMAAQRMALRRVAVLPISFGEENMLC
jgi:hypothetical protein